MLRSMTGHGGGTAETDTASVTAEVRAVNNRGLKVSVRTPLSDAALDVAVEKLVRDRVRRGSVTVTVATESKQDAAEAVGFVDQVTLKSYHAAAVRAARELNLPVPQDIVSLMRLPGVIDLQRRPEVDVSQESVLEAVSQALESLESFRQTEGDAMRAAMAEGVATLRTHAAAVEGRAPQVVEEFRDRLHERVGELLARHGVEPLEETVLREVSVFAEKADIHEELTRLSAHLGQFETLLSSTDVEGRKLDFLCQEIFREVNTVGSKGNDLEIARHVVDMKGTAEKIREMVQNVE